MADIGKMIIDELIDSVLDKDTIKDALDGKDDKDRKPKKRKTSSRSRSTSRSRSSASMVELEVFGPVTLPVTGSGKKREVSKEDVDRFWDYSAAEDVAAKEGVFIFVLKNGQKYTPWYLGKATKSLKTSTLGGKAKGEINTILAREKGSPFIFFVAPAGNKRSFPSKELTDCARFLTQSCLAANPKLEGGGATPPMWAIDGVIRGSGRASKSEKDFAYMLGL